MVVAHEHLESVISSNVCFPDGLFRRLPGVWKHLPFLLHFHMISCASSHLLLLSVFPFLLFTLTPFLFLFLSQLARLFLFCFPSVLCLRAALWFPRLVGINAARLLSLLTESDLRSSVAACVELTVSCTC